MLTKFGRQFDAEPPQEKRKWLFQRMSFADLKRFAVSQRDVGDPRAQMVWHMIKLYGSAFSPFARKVRMTLEYKDLHYEAVDGLLKSNHQVLKAVNGRVEVPVLTDGDVVVVNSPDIVAYLDHAYPTKSVYPNGPAARVHARAWERAADTFVDPILIDVSYWKWLNGRTKCLKAFLRQHVLIFGLSTTLSTRNSPTANS